MDAATIEKLIESLGKPYRDLSTQHIIADIPLTELYKGRDWLTLKPENGIELSFWADTGRFERLFVTLLETVEGTTRYEGELPAPFATQMSQASVREKFGTPTQS